MAGDLIRLYTFGVDVLQLRRHHEYDTHTSTFWFILHTRIPSEGNKQAP